MLFIKVKTEDQGDAIINCNNITSIEVMPEDKKLTKIYMNGQKPIIAKHPICHFSMRLLDERDDLSLTTFEPHGH